HEFVGTVESAPSAREWEGRRVVGEINAACGQCGQCQAGRRTHCERRTVLGIVSRNGAHATHLALPVANLHAVPDDLPDDIAVFTEPVAAALEIHEQVAVRARDRVIVIGAGKLGQLIAQTLAATGCRLSVVGRDLRRLEPLRALGIATVEAEQVEPRSADIVVECTGSPEGLGLARAMLRPRGTLVLKSTYHGRTDFDFSALVVDEITLVGSRCGPFAPALRALAEGGVQVGHMVQARYPLGQARRAFEHAAQPGVLKVLLEP
ncbi:MAG TPA: alcohol dehydrogenase catalytic domain-containing protein, partial [Vicinamibacteria bacterium]|nr:alcohol dehydrogenase catalytic domain-containing protein [Vicinamibacteria bacterium]